MIMRFKNKDNRDAKARELQAQGMSVTKSSSRSVVLSANYVADEDLTTASRNMFGGYDTEFYPRLYSLEAR